MTKVITYGTYDLLHYGHIRLLERAKQLGDYLIVGVTADDYDKVRGKINVHQSLMERVEAVRATGLADEIIIEEYEGQKIDDIKRYNIDIFTVGSDWLGKFDYLKDYCKVVYLERTQGVSSSEIRDERGNVRLGLVGDSSFLNKVATECGYVNGIHLAGVYTDNYVEMLDYMDAVYIRSQPECHYYHIREALLKGKHVLCESPMTLDRAEFDELQKLAREKKLILMEALKTAYSTAYARLLLLLKGEIIGDIVAVDATCTSLRNLEKQVDMKKEWNGIFEWGPTALLPVFQILGIHYDEKKITVKYEDREQQKDSFVKMDFYYPDAVASIKVGSGVKSEGELIISGTKGYVYVPAPWWKTEYFEVRYENSTENKRYFYQLEGEGIRHELVAFIRSIEKGKSLTNIGEDITREISGVMEDYVQRRDVRIIK